MKRLLIASDLHLRGKKLKDIATAWDKTVKWAHHNEVDQIICCGDIFDNSNLYSREASTGTVANAFLSPFDDFNPKIPFFSITGNHDLSGFSNKDALTLIERYPWISVVRKPSVVKINDGMAICAVPWLNKAHLITKQIQNGVKPKEAARRVQEALISLATNLTQEVEEEHKEGRFVLFCGHLEITGAKREGGTLQENGSFEFSPEELKNIGCDAYSIGHIHVRQNIPLLPNENDGYVGSLCQLSFGEEGQQNGCRLIEIDGMKIISDKWLENKNSPKYHTVTSLENLNYRPKIDYVKYRGHIRPNHLPEGIIFEKLPSIIQSKTRQQHNLQCTSSISDLLEAWKEKEKCSVDLSILTEQANEIISTTPVQSESIGSLERIECIKVENITVHQSTEILTNFNGICGICGPNGSGKTTAIESICLAAYGISPSRPVLKSILPKHETVDSFSEITIISSGKKYRIKREFSKKKKTFSHSALVYDENDKILSGPGILEVNKFCSDLIGDSDLVLAGIFSSQGDSGNAINLDPAPRKELFAKLLGTEKFLAYSDAAKKLVYSDAVLVGEKNSKLETIRNSIAMEEQESKLLAKMKEDIKLNELIKETKEKEIDGHKEKLNLIKEKQKESFAAQEEKRKLERELVDVSAEGKLLRAKKTEFESISSEEIENKLKNAKKDAEELQVINESIRKKLESNLENQKMIGSLKDELSEVNEKINSEYEKHKAEKQKEIDTIKLHNDEIMLKINEIDQKINLIEAKKTTTLENIENANKKSKLMLQNGFPDLPECKKCPLAKDIIALAEGIPALKEEVDKLNGLLVKGRAKREEVMKEIMPIISFITPKDGMFPKEEQKVKELLSKINAIKSDSSISKELNERKNALSESIKNIPIYESNLEKIKSKEKDLIKIEAEIESLRSKYKKIETKIKEFVVPTAPTYEEMELIRTTVSEYQNAISKANEALKKLNFELGKKTAAIENIDKLKKEIGEIENEIKDKKQRVEVLNSLVSAFGRDGIPQLIVDTSIPHLNDILHNLLSECDGKWSMRVSSFKEDAKGKVSERIDVLVDDGDEERDISTYSGGEKNFLEYVFRVAFSILQAERSGKGLKVLVLDEPMYFADDCLSDSFMRILNKLKDKFNQIFIISHSDYILSTIENKIHFSRGENGFCSVQTEYVVA